MYGILKKRCVSLTFSRGTEFQIPEREKATFGGLPPAS